MFRFIPGHSLPAHIHAPREKGCGADNVDCFCVNPHLHGPAVVQLFHSDIADFVKRRKILRVLGDALVQNNSGRVDGNEAPGSLCGFQTNLTMSSLKLADRAQRRRPRSRWEVWLPRWPPSGIEAHWRRPSGWPRHWPRAHSGTPREVASARICLAIVPRNPGR